MRLSLTLSCLVLTLGPLACAPRPPGAELASNPVVLPRDMVGCYALFDHEGRPASDSLAFAPPKVRLDSARHQRSLLEGSTESRWTLARMDAAGNAITEHSSKTTLYWAAAPSDSIRIRLSSGFYGSELIVARRTRGDTIRGRATEHTDVGPPFETAAGPVTMIRIPCFSEAR